MTEFLKGRRKIIADFSHKTEIIADFSHKTEIRPRGPLSIGGLFHLHFIFVLILRKKD